MTTALAVSGPAPVGGASDTVASRDGFSTKGGSDEGLSEFLSVRPRLLGLARHMLGSASEAEDVVQDVWVRWQTTNRGAVRNPAAFLVTAATRLAINVLRSARVRRRSAATPSLPEAIASGPDPNEGVERSERLRLAVLVLLAKLPPAERAAYVLREAFSYRYRDIADLLSVAEAHARQLVTRARAHVSSRRIAPVTPAEQWRLHDAFVAAASTGDLQQLERLLVSGLVPISHRRSVAAPGAPRDIATPSLTLSHVSASPGH